MLVGVPLVNPTIMNGRQMMSSANTPEFRLLGPLVAVHNNQRVVLTPDREQRLLVALLAARSASVSRTSLIEWIWDIPGKSAKESLNELMWKLRTWLTPLGLRDALISGNSMCRLEIPDDSVDLHRFRRLVGNARASDDERAALLLNQAVGLFADEPLGALCGERVNNFRTTLLDECMSARIEYADVCLRLGRQEKILPELARLSRTEPFHEKVAGLLMRAHYQNNDQKRALDVFSHITEQLRENLGTDPSKELAELHQRILKQDPRLSVVVPEKHDGRPEENMADSDEPAEQPRTLYTTGTKNAFGDYANVGETLFITISERAPRPRPGRYIDGSAQ